MKKLLLGSLYVLAFSTSPVLAKVAFAERVASYVSPVSSGCMTENAQINVNFNGVESDPALVKGKFDAKMAEIEKALKDAGLDKVEMQSMNYNINPQNYGSASTVVQYNGNISYTVAPSGKATSVMADLIKKGFQASVNVSAYRNGGVPCPQAGSDKKQ